VELLLLALRYALHLLLALRYALHLLLVELKLVAHHLPPELLKDQSNVQED
jgi:hypothetical protein